MVFKKEQANISSAGLTWLALVLLMPMAGYWHAWQWYFNRVSASFHEAIGLLAILTFLIFSAIRRIKHRKVVYGFSPWPIALLLLLYGLSFLLTMPPIIRAGLAFSTVFLIAHWAAFGDQPPAAFWALIAVSLPVVPSLQFYLGFPARYVSASLTVPLLKLNGMSVSRSGTNLIWQNQVLQFDAPCSGITMLWAGLFLTLALSWIHRFSLLRTIAAVAIASVFVLIGNVLRAGSLFYLETGTIGDEMAWLHEGVGVTAFLLIAAGIMVTLSRFLRCPAGK